MKVQLAEYVSYKDLTFTIPTTIKGLLFPELNKFIYIDTSIHMITPHLPSLSIISDMELDDSDAKLINTYVILLDIIKEKRFLLRSRLQELINCKVD